jgi:hypothetical protein
MVYLAVKNGKILYHTDIAEMKKAGITKPDVEMEDEDFKALGGYARIVNGKIVVGMTTDEKTENDRQAQIQGWKDELAHIDKEAGAGRAVRGAALAAAKKAGVSNEDTAHLQDFEDRATELRQKISQKKK